MKTVELKIQVLNQLDSYIEGIIDDIIKIDSNFPAVYNYLSWEEAMKRNINGKYKSWREVAGIENNNSLNIAIDSFCHLQITARNSQFTPNILRIFS